MTVLSYKEFMDEARDRLEALSGEELRNIILSWASEEHPSNRQQFLSKLTPKTQVKEVVTDAGKLIDKIEAFAQRVGDGEYCSGWRWDDDIGEERDWGDESWAGEMDQFFMQARSALLGGKYKLAKG